MRIGLPAGIADPLLLQGGIDDPVARAAVQRIVRRRREGCPGIPREGLQPIGVADARLRIGTVRIDDLDTAAAAGIDEFGRCARQVEDAAGDAHGDVSGRVENGAAVLDVLMS